MEKNPLAVVPVDLGPDKPKLNLTLLEGADLKETGILTLVIVTHNFILFFMS